MKLIHTVTGDIQEAFGATATNMLAGGVWIVHAVEEAVAEVAAAVEEVAAEVVAAVAEPAPVEAVTATSIEEVPQTDQTGV